MERHPGWFLTVVCGAVGIFIAAVLAVFSSEVGGMNLRAKFGLSGAALLLCVVAVLVAKVYLMPRRAIPSLTKEAAIPKVETPQPKRPTPEERNRKDFDAIVGILTSFLNHRNGSPSCEVLRRLAGNDRDCRKLADEIERDFKHSQSERGDNYRVQAKRLTSIGGKLDKLIADTLDEELRREGKMEKERDELQIMTDALYEELKQFCGNLSGYEFKWRNEEVRDVY